MCVIAIHPLWIAEAMELVLGFSLSVVFFCVCVCVCLLIVAFASSAAVAVAHKFQFRDANDLLGISVKEVREVLSTAFRRFLMFLLFCFLLCCVFVCCSCRDPALFGYFVRPVGLRRLGSI